MTGRVRVAAAVVCAVGLVVGVVGCGGDGGARVKMVAAEPILDGVPGWAETRHVEGHGVDQIADVREDWLAPVSAAEAKAEVIRRYAGAYIENPGQIEQSGIRWTTRDRKTTIDLDFRPNGPNSTEISVRLRRAP